MAKIYIAGAHSRGITTGFYLKYLDPSLEIGAYLYDNDEDNPSDVDGVPVIRIDADTKLEVDIVVYLATRGVNRGHLTDTLRKIGMKHIVPVDVKFDTELRNRFLTKYFAEQNREFIKIYNYNTEEGAPLSAERKRFQIYVASAVFDQKLSNAYSLDESERVIQVGTALADQRLDAAYFDNTGDNISEKNRQFCELTALYWIWKNAREDVVGLAHYRRHFVLPDNWKQIMDREKIDVILPVPLYVYPSLEDNFRNRHVGEKWDEMLLYLKENRPEDYENASHFFKNSGLFFPCNMLIARKEVFDELCEWLFPIEFHVAEAGGALEDRYQNRYPAFISERLITYFFEMNREKYHIVYADKNFLE
uniref:DUF4422 domain-containing protein n=1 Tax=Eubacterium cellulosolvens TaxID=29322 RepID=UPI0004815684|nr:DUF4422 domain-containing protein [[Eubacterium] cellulosolvens]